MNKSCGFLIETPSGYLIGHATRTFHWDVFKGGSDEYEDDLTAAKRECLEESGLNIDELPGTITDLGLHPYRPGKQLHLFLFKSQYDIDTSLLTCHSMVEKSKTDIFPEIDKFAIVHASELEQLLAKNLYKWIECYALRNNTSSTPNFS